MNRHQRRAQAAKARAGQTRLDAITATLEVLRASPEDVTGATLMLPSGEVLHLSADVARAAAPGKGARH